MDNFAEGSKNFLIWAWSYNWLAWFQEWIELLRDMVLKLPEVENLSYLKALCSADAEQDFFNNIIHLQVKFPS